MQWACIQHSILMADHNDQPVAKSKEIWALYIAQFASGPALSVVTILFPLLLASQAKYVASRNDGWIEWRVKHVDGDLCGKEGHPNDREGPDPYGRPEGYGSDCVWFPVERAVPVLGLDYTNVAVSSLAIILLGTGVSLLVAGPYGDYGSYRRTLLTVCISIWVPLYLGLIGLPDPSLYWIGAIIGITASIAFTFGLRAPLNAYLPLLVDSHHEIADLKKMLESDIESNSSTNTESSFNCEVSGEDETPVWAGNENLRGNSIAINGGHQIRSNANGADVRPGDKLDAGIDEKYMNFQSNKNGTDPTSVERRCSWAHPVVRKLTKGLETLSHVGDLFSGSHQNAKVPLYEYMSFDSGSLSRMSSKEVQDSAPSFNVKGKTDNSQSYGRNYVKRSLSVPGIFNFDIGLPKKAISNPKVAGYKKEASFVQRKSQTFGTTGYLPEKILSSSRSSKKEEFESIEPTHKTSREEVQQRSEAIAASVSLNTMGFQILGQFIGFIFQSGIVLALTSVDDGPEDSLGLRLSIGFASVWGAALSAWAIPNLKKRRAPDFPPGNRFTLGARRMISTISLMRRNLPHLLNLMLGRMFLWLGVNTILMTAAVFFEREFGLQAKDLMLLILIFFGAGAPATVGTKLFIDTFRGTTMAVFKLYCLITILMPVYMFFFLTTVVEVYIMMVLASMLTTPIQALVWALMAEMIPNGYTTTIMSFEGLLENISAWLGPLLIGVLLAVTGSMRWGLFSMLAFILISIPFVWSVKTDVARDQKEEFDRHEMAKELRKKCGLDN